MDGADIEGAENVARLLHRRTMTAISPARSMPCRRGGRRCCTLGVPRSRHCLGSSGAERWPRQPACWLLRRGFSMTSSIETRTALAR